MTLYASILVSRDGLDSLPVAVTGHVEPGSRAKDGSCVIVVDSAVWEKDVLTPFALGVYRTYDEGEPVTLTDAEEDAAEEVLFLTI